MSVQYVVNITIENPESLAKYREGAGAALAKHGGSLVSALPEPQVLECSVSVPSMTAVIEFPSKEKAEAWRKDPELKELHALRTGAGATSVVELPAIK